MTGLAPFDAPMTIEDFLDFVATRPDEEKWELIGGEPVMNAAPAWPHQRIVARLIAALIFVEDRTAPAWSVIPGIGVRLSDISVPVPDVLVRPREAPAGNVCDDMIVAFEVLSPSTRLRDLRWKHNAYKELAALQHYVVIEQDRAELFVFDRASGFSERRLAGLDAVLTLDALGVSLPLADLYRDSGVKG